MIKMLRHCSWILMIQWFFIVFAVEASAQHEEVEEENTITEEEAVPDDGLSVDQIEKIMEKSETKKREQGSSAPTEGEDTFSSLADYFEQEKYLVEEERKKKQLEVSEQFSDRVRDFHTSLSENIVSIADSIDSFFINKSITDGRNRTNIRVSNLSNWLEGSGLRNTVDFKVRLRLPQLQRRIQLEIEDNSLNDDSTAAKTNVSQNLANNAQTQQGIGTRGGLSVYQKLLGIETKWSSGVMYRNKVGIFGRFRLSRDFIITPSQKITFIHNLYDDTTDNRQQFGVLNYDIAFNKMYLLRFSNEENYRDIDHSFKTNHGLYLYQQISDRNFLSYSYRIEAVNPNTAHSFYLNSHNLNVTFRRRVYREHVFYELGPGLTFPKSHDFEALWLFVLKLEVIFGNI